MPMSFAGHGAEAGEDSRETRSRPAATPACEACRKLKMKCTRDPAAATPKKHDNTPEPCDRCKKTNRSCKIPVSRPVGRRRGALGRYHGLDKAYRKLQAEAKKANISPAIDKIIDSSGLRTVEDQGLGSFLTEDPSTRPPFSTPGHGPVSPVIPFLGQDLRAIEIRARTEHQQQEYHDDQDSNEPDQDPLSNPLALLAYASDAAQASEMRPLSEANFPEPKLSMESGSTNGQTEGHRLLYRPGYVSLGLQLERQSLVQGLDNLLACVGAGHQSLDYFKRRNSLRGDVGPDLDPVDLGLITMDEAHRLFPIYFARLHPVNGILDPNLHTPDFVRARSCLLFTWILTLTALFDYDSASIAEPLRLHGEKLSRYVHTSGYKSVEIVQGYYISLLSATPARTLAEERTWLYTMYAIGVATDLGMNQEAELLQSASSDTYNSWNSASPLSKPGSISRHPIGPWTEHESYQQRLLRNRERTWLRILLWERANSAACGRIQAFPESNLTQSIETWWLHPLADMTDKYTCAFIILRKVLGSLQVKIKNQFRDPGSDSHWIREMIEVSLHEWRNAWLSSSQTQDIMSPMSPSEQMSMVFLRYVYEHGRLWTLSLTLSGLGSGDQRLGAIRQDCFESAVNCCETFVRDLQTIGEPLHCMLAPTWAMISYAAVMTLKLFPTLYGHRPGNDLELLSLLSQVAMQLQKAGTTPPHRSGIAAILGQHLMMILRARAVGHQQPKSQKQHLENTHESSEWQLDPSEITQRTSLVSDWDPFLTPAISDHNDIGAEGLNDFFREMFGPGFGDFL